MLGDERMVYSEKLPNDTPLLTIHEGVYVELLTISRGKFISLVEETMKFFRILDRYLQRLKQVN